MINTNYPVVPHMIRIFETNENLRLELSIPNDSIVFGRYGGLDTFDLDFVHNAIKDIIEKKR